MAASVAQTDLGWAMGPPCWDVWGQGWARQWGRPCALPHHTVAPAPYTSCLQSPGPCCAPAQGHTSAKSLSSVADALLSVTLRSWMV